MSEEQLKAFIAKVQADASLQQQLKAAADGDEVIIIARKAGFSINVEDVASFKGIDRELSEEELEAFAGGYPGAFDPGFLGKNIGRVAASLADKKCRDGVGEALSRKPQPRGPNWGNLFGKVPKTGCFATL